MKLRNYKKYNLLLGIICLVSFGFIAHVSYGNYKMEESSYNALDKRIGDSLTDNGQTKENSKEELYELIIARSTKPSIANFIILCFGILILSISLWYGLSSWFTNLLLEKSKNNLLNQMCVTNLNDLVNDDEKNKLIGLIFNYDVVDSFNVEIKLAELEDFKESHLTYSDKNLQKMGFNEMFDFIEHHQHLSNSDRCLLKLTYNKLINYCDTFDGLMNWEDVINFLNKLDKSISDYLNGDFVTTMNQVINSNNKLSFFCAMTNDYYDLVEKNIGEFLLSYEHEIVRNQVSEFQIKFLTNQLNDYINRDILIDYNYLYFQNYTSYSEFKIIKKMIDYDNLIIEDKEEYVIKINRDIKINHDSITTGLNYFIELINSCEEEKNALFAKNILSKDYSNEKLLNILSNNKNIEKFINGELTVDVVVTDLIENEYDLVVKDIYDRYNLVKLFSFEKYVTENVSIEQFVNNKELLLNEENQRYLVLNYQI